MAKKIIRCYCGYVAEGTDVELITAVRGHVRDVHHMEYTPDQVLAMAEPIE